MEFERLGIFATAEEIAYIKECQSRPLVAMTNPAPPGPGVPHAVPMFTTPIEAAHRAALAHGLPQIPGYYGIDLSNGEFIIASDSQGGSTKGEAKAPLPRYKCHKEVWALKIKDIRRVPSGNATVTHTLVPEDARYAPFEVSLEYIGKHAPQPGGYYVVYADGYISYSPARAFEEGYSLLETPPNDGGTEHGN